MSSKWEKLDKEFYDVIDNMTDEQWHYWRNNQAKNQALRQAKMKLEMEIHLQKLYFQGLGGRVIYQNPASNLLQYANINGALINNFEVSNMKLTEFNTLEVTVEPPYSLAA
jgi:hypothetical protein